MSSRCSSVVNSRRVRSCSTIIKWPQQLQTVRFTGTGPNSGAPFIGSIPSSMVSQHGQDVGSILIIFAIAHAELIKAAPIRLEGRPHSVPSPNARMIIGLKQVDMVGKALISAAPD